MTTSTLSSPPNTHARGDGLLRWLPLAGAAYAVLSLAGDLVIDRFPDENTSTSALTRYYAVHHVQVGRGGQIAMLGSLFLGLFAAGLVARARHLPAVAAVIAVGGAAMVAMDAQTGATFALLGQIGNDAHVDPAALQAWHISGAAYGSSMPSVIFLVGVALAALTGRVAPRWVGWTSAALAVGLTVPGLIGFFVSMISLLWFVATGISLSVRARATE
jgi:hypothetical protein